MSLSLSFDDVRTQERSSNDLLTSHSGLVAIHLRNSCVVSPGIAHSPTQVVPPCSGNTTLSFEDKSSPDNPRTPTFVPHFGVLTITTPQPQYRIFVNGFWSGFLEKTDANHIGFFETIFPKSVVFTNNIHSANVLLETVFADSLVHVKNWLYKIQYSGEARWCDTKNYDLTLYCDTEHTDNINIQFTKHGNNRLNLPLFVYYIHSNNLLERLINRPIRTTVPTRFCCFIVSNGGCEVRNKMFHLLNQYKKVDSCGNFNNNTENVLPFNYCTQEFIQFISNYKFIICFENSKIGTYSTEKIVNPYLANIIPIYWSSHYIKNTLNEESMLFLEDEHSDSYEHLIEQIIELDSNDEKYLEMVNCPVFKQMDHWKNNYSIEVLSNKMEEFFNIKKHNIKFYITHYTPLKDRRVHINHQLKCAGINDYTFVLTKDREALTQNDLVRFTKITPGEISLFYKHLEVYNTAPEDEIIVIFEDDSILCNDFLKHLDRCLSELQNEEWDILFAGDCANLHCNVEPDKMVKHTGGSRATGLCVLNVGVGRKIYDIFMSQSNIHAPIDWWLNELVKPYDLKFFWSEPPLAMQGSGNGLFRSSLR